MERLVLVVLVAGAVHAANNCTASCPKSRMSQLNPNLPEVRNAHLQAIKMKILRHLGSHHASNLEMVPDRSREALALLAEGALEVNQDLGYLDPPDQEEVEENSRMVIFADQDITCPPEAQENTLLCLKFDTSRIPHPSSIVRAELGIFFSTSGANESFTLRSQRQNLSQGLRINGTSSNGWVRFDVTMLATLWARDVAADGLQSLTNQMVQLECPTCKSNAYNQIRDAKESPFLMISSSPDRAGKRRLKRSNVDCSMSNMQKGCCRAPFEVNFHEDLGWKWIVIPKTFSPNFCRGQCELEVNKLGAHGLAKNDYIKAYPRQAQNIELSLCCAPKVFKPLTIVYFVNKDTLTVATIKDMIVEECECM